MAVVPEALPWGTEYNGFAEFHNLKITFNVSTIVSDVFDTIYELAALTRRSRLR
jgi:hypothetical protein